MIPSIRNWMVVSVVELIPVAPVFGQVRMIAVCPVVWVLPVLIWPRWALEVVIVVRPIGAVGPVWSIHVGGHPWLDDSHPWPCDRMGEQFAPVCREVDDRVGPRYNWVIASRGGADTAQGLGAGQSKGPVQLHNRNIDRRIRISGDRTVQSLYYLNYCIIIIFQ